jgi:predicted ATP-grasp superfamily ATP-dependent carboligase
MNTLGMAVGCGVDLPLIGYNDVVGIQQEPNTDWKDGTVWLWWEQDWQAAKDLRRQGLLTYRSWLKSLRGERIHAIFSADDLRPVSRYYGKVLPRMLGNTLKGGLGSCYSGVMAGLDRLRQMIASFSPS